MSFWTESNITPKRNFRFLIEITNLAAPGQAQGTQSIVWWAKSVKVPAFDVAETQHQFLDNTYNFPGRVTWQDVNMTLVDPASPDAVALTNHIMEQFYSIKSRDALSGPKTVSKKGAVAALGSVIIRVLDEEGQDVEKWTLNNPFIKSVSYSDLAYDNEDLRTIDITFKYDWARCETNDGDFFYPRAN